MGLARELGIDPESMTWEDWAACRGMGWQNFFVSPSKSEVNDDEDVEEIPPGYEDAVIAKSVDDLCFSCPVQKACGVYGMQNKLEGVWGGMYLNTRGKPDRKRNEHKTEADWKHLGEVFDGLHK